jgi:DNA-binding MarR family transcriptional regulator
MFITPIQKITLKFISQFIMANGFAPTIQEVASDRGVFSNAAKEHVDALVKKGFVTKQTHKARSIVITELGREALV